jgi:hypothetical protein
LRPAAVAKKARKAPWDRVETVAYLIGQVDKEPDSDDSGFTVVARQAFEPIL